MESDDEGGKRRLERKGVLEWERGIEERDWYRKKRRRIRSVSRVGREEWRDEKD